MLEFLLSDVNLPYSIAIGFVLALALMEGLGLMIGLSLMNIVGQVTHVEVDADMDLTSGGLTPLVGWLCLNRLPLLIWLVIILTTFGIFGLTLNYCLAVKLKVMLPSYVGVFSSAVFALYLTRAIATPLAKLLPKNESSAQSNQSFKGLVGKITIGTAEFNSPAEAVIHDSFQQKHYVLVAPEHQDEVFIAGSEVVLMEKVKHYWLAAPFQQFK